MVRWTWMLAAALAAAALPAAAEATLGCGSFAPFGTSCEDCCAVLGGTPQVSSQLLGYTGALEMRLAHAGGALAWRCSTVVLDGARLPPGVTSPTLETCEGPWAEGVPPTAGTHVALACKAMPLAPPAPPQGPWGCRAEP